MRLCSVAALSALKVHSLHVDLQLGAQVLHSHLLLFTHLSERDHVVVQLVAEEKGRGTKWQGKNKIKRSVRIGRHNGFGVFGIRFTSPIYSIYDAITAWNDRI